ncbi:MAG: thermonuclease family protein, partial [Rhodocyclaceae bacterium]
MHRFLVALFMAALLAGCEAPTASGSVPVSTTAAVATDARAAKVRFTVTGTITQVSDGDTLSIASATGTTIIRMSDLDTPEVAHGPQRPGQRFGRAAESALKSIAPIGAQARAECYERDQYQRSVCTVFVGPQNLNLEQIERGW